MATVTFENATRVYPGATTPAVDALNLEIKDGEFLVLVGPSGCGKSTSLRMLAGLEDVNSGRIYIGDRDVTDVSPKDRDIAMVFQNYALYPHMTVADNMGFALKIAGEKKEVIRQRVEEAAKILDLTQYLDRKPKALSGGQRQRVAMGRAIVRKPQVFLMDEPLSNLDAKLRVQTRTQIASLQRSLGVTTVYVTHDQTEALTMGDRIAVLKDGILQQVASPAEMFSRPANAFVAGFIGSPAMNLGPWRIEGSDAVFGDARFSLPAPVLDAVRADGSLIVGLRPEALEVAGPGEGGIPIKVTFVESLGSDAYVYGTIVGAERESDSFGSGDQSETMVVRIEPYVVPKAGEIVYLKPKAEHTHFFSASTGSRIETGAEAIIENVDNTAAEVRIEDPKA
ncbi:ABC transporter ATP-binding protein [Trueperella pyogenes]|uniref:sn-glycerol-3-phosphate ABC transporter ATP-binding protein UgpC n=1 Tax=Trueperella pyogenes TaxID=1661 RepID=A0A380MBG2_9ACTO|nr:sn-glycerol-3-phosphate ABC transporter ATP-binding protein UgpC [Trueperella pyogenes]AJC68942.1 sugar ABC transporter ATP-binding protein [Trueperella pyogenes TP8]AZR06871.1 sn-glycerol-3-phosphate ABC transporter ATP-binding protein UgpC [Trueperella pyogenes]QIU87048.1 sn-glycerol-3-phosphate ABC transporter ATP-binding protein UgpC [Trueperella pyogenes]SUO86505.1 sn-glycerol-3-phosphate import ATP-binding protein UgpC [Trueperella pyogenes]